MWSVPQVVVMSIYLQALPWLRQEKLAFRMLQNHRPAHIPNFYERKSKFRET